MYVHILVIRLQMLGHLSFFSCACGLAATKGEGKEKIKVLNKEGKTNAKHMERRRQHLRKWQLLSLGYKSWCQLCLSLVLSYLASNWQHILGLYF